MRPVTKGMRPPKSLQGDKDKKKQQTAQATKDKAAAKAKAKGAKGGPDDIVIDVIVAYTKKAADQLRRRQARACRALHRGGRTSRSA